MGGGQDLRWLAGPASALSSIRSLLMQWRFSPTSTGYVPASLGAAGLCTVVVSRNTLSRAIAAETCSCTAAVKSLANVGRYVTDGDSARFILVFFAVFVDHGDLDFAILCAVDLKASRLQSLSIESLPDLSQCGGVAFDGKLQGSEDDQLLPGSLLAVGRTDLADLFLE